MKNWTLSGEGVDSMPAHVPGDVTAELFACGRIPDPLYGKNNESLAWIAEKEWVYTCVFRVSGALLAHARVRLCFEGIDTLASIALNGVLLGKTDNMFLRYDHSVKEYLREGENELTVTLPSATKYAREHNDGKNYRALFTQNRIWLRKAQCHWGWDWAPDLPGIGIWLPVYLLVDGGRGIADVRVEPYLSGQVRFTVWLEQENGASFVPAEGEYTLRAETGGVVCEVPVCGSAEVLNVQVESPELWWPNGYGKQRLYAYTVALLHRGKPIAVKTGRFGFREVRLCEDPLGAGRSAFALCVNGRRIFAKGSNWVPCSTMTGAIEEERYRRYLYAAKEAGFSLLRVWGGGIYEKELFYDLCDELGILVWQDFMFSCSAVPAMFPEVRESFLREAAYQIRRLRGHACMALWCGGNEYMPQLNGVPYAEGNELIRVVLRGLVGELDGRTPYIHNSPCGRTDDEWRLETGDGHVSCMDEPFVRGGFEKFRLYIAENPTQFASECAHLGPSRLRSLRKFIPEKEIRACGGETWEHHFVKNPYASNGDTFLGKEKRYAEEFFGQISGVEDFVKKGMCAQEELLAAEIDHARANVNCRGFLNWMYNDIWGCGTWAVIDRYFEKKPAFYAMKRGFSPLRLCFTEERGVFFVSLCNDTRRRQGGELVLRAKTLGGKTVGEQKTRLYAEADGCARLPVALCGGEYWTAELFGGGRAEKAIFFPRLWKGLPFRSGLRYNVRCTKSGFAVRIFADVFAKTVFLDLPDNTDVVFSDNFFDMEKGDVRTVKVQGVSAEQIARLTVKTFADVWQD